MEEAACRLGESPRLAIKWRIQSRSRHSFACLSGARAVRRARAEDPATRVERDNN